MDKSQKPKWQKEIELILKKRYQGDELSERLEKAYELIGVVVGMEPPCDDYGEIAGTMMKLASQELPPLASIYTGFMLGVAYERLRNAK